MAYHALDHNSAIDYLRTVDSLEGILDTGGDLRTKEVGDGNLNLVFIVENRENLAQSVVLKQVLPYLRVTGESWPLAHGRMRFETQALFKHNEAASGLVPEIYHTTRPCQRLDSDRESGVVLREEPRRSISCTLSQS